MSTKIAFNQVDGLPVNVKDFGAVGDGVTQDSVALMTAFQFGIDNDVAVYIPSGTYITQVGPDSIRLFDWSLSSGRFCIFGDGATSVIKMEDDGVSGTGQNMFDIRPNIDMEHILLKDFVLDNNGASITTHPGGGAWEQSHTLRYACATGFTTKLLEYNGIVIKGRIADGMNNQGLGRITDWKIINCSDDKTRLYTRSSIQQSKQADTLTITGFVGESVESEPTSTPAITSRVIIDGCSLERIDAASKSVTDRTSCEYYVSNSTVTNQATFSQCYFRVSNSVIKIASDGLIKYPVIGSGFSNCKILLPYDSGSTTLTTLRFTAQAGEFGCSFDSCEIKADTDYAGNITGNLLGTNLACAVADVDLWNWSFSSCKFDKRAERTAYIYRGGTWRITDCKLVGHDSAFYFATSNTHGVKLYVDGADCTDLTGSFMGGAWSTPDQSTTIAQAFLSGEYYGAQAGVISTVSGGPSLQLTTMVVSTRNLNLPALPTAGFKGDTVTIPHKPVGEPCKYQCTAQSITLPNFRMIRQSGIAKDVTGSRYTPSANDVGLMYFDTTLDADGKPIWWTGAAWVDAQGTTV